VLKEIEMQVGYNEYRGYPVVVFPEFGEDKKAGFDRLMSTSGFACAVMDSATRKSTAEHFEDCPELIQAFDKVPDGYFILVEYELYQKLGEELSCVLLDHEIGHILGDHLNPEKATPVNGVVLNDEFELEADAHAASVHGHQKVAESLVSCISALWAIGADYKVFDEEQRKKFLETSLGGEHMKKRLNALNA
jgi:hypothetical protein